MKSSNIKNIYPNVLFHTAGCFKCLHDIIFALKRCRVGTLNIIDDTKKITEFCQKHKTDIIIFNVSCSLKREIQDLEKIIENSSKDQTIIVFVVCDDDGMELLLNLQMNNIDIIQWPVESACLDLKLQNYLYRSKIISLQKSLALLTEENHKLHQLVDTDGLTGLLNRRAFDRLIAQYLLHAKREKMPLSVLLLDVDYFKNYNDSLGHQKGDACLVLIAATLQKICHRPMDAVTRYGGEEFAILLPNTESTGAQYFAQQCIERIFQLQIPHPGSAILPVVSISCGLMTVNPHHDSIPTPSDVLKSVDQALYHAKSNGRNQVHRTG